jgi:hypothetical protein
MSFHVFKLHSTTLSGDSWVIHLRSGCKDEVGGILLGNVQITLAIGHSS